MSRIAIIGSGYVGLSTGAYLAHIGHEVVCLDVVAAKVEQLNRGEIPIFEVGLEEMVRSGLDSGRLRFVLDRGEALRGAEFVFLCLPTPQGTDGSADLSYVQQEAEQMGPFLDTNSVVINKSTLPVGSTRLVERSLGRGDVHVVSNPEFLREGSAVHDCLNPERIVIGADDTAAASRVAALYDRIHAPVLVTDPASAELIKYASNAFLATKISYINAIANLCEAVGADVKEVVLGMGYDKRIGFEFLRPGPGWGGSCFHPDETILTRRSGQVRLLTFGALFAAVERVGADGWEALTWDPDLPEPEFRAISAFTSRPFAGDLVEVRTQMGRRVRVTPDHPFVVSDGADLETVGCKAAGDLTTADWLPNALGFPDGGRDDRAAAAGPDAVWHRPAHERRTFLRDVWDGAGSWSRVAGAPGAVLACATESALSADRIVRLLASVGIVARTTVAPSSTSGGETYSLTISGAEQLQRCLWLLPDAAHAQVRAALADRPTRIGHRRTKSTAWLRVTDLRPVPYTGPVYSVEVPATHTVVVTQGLVAHNCFPKDTRALVRIAEDAGYDFGLLEGVIEVNREQHDRMVAKIAASCPGGVVEGAVIGVWGLTFKALTDDVRDSPALEVVGRLVARGARVQAYDPMVTPQRAATMPQLHDVEVRSDPYAACAGADVMVLLTEWDEFRWVDFAKVHDQLAHPTVVDCRNLLDPAPLRRRGFTYVGVGRR